MEKRKIGIMGGTFNPIHYGHLTLARTSYEVCELDEVIFIPTGQPYLKNQSNLASKEMRLEMTKLAIEDIPFFSWSNLEQKREGNTYTCDTIKELRLLYPQVRFYFIMGADSLFSIENWKNPEIIFEYCTLVVAVRDEKAMDELQKKGDDLSQRFGAVVELLPMHQIHISSTDIRNRIMRREGINELLPPKVADYIRYHHLYLQRT